MSVFSLKDHLVAAAADPHVKVMKWRPKGNHAFVLPLVEASMSRGGIIAPDQSRERPQKGVVLSIGKGLWDDEQAKLFPVECSAGDLITYGKYSGSLFEIGAPQGIEVFIMVNPEIKAFCSVGDYDLTEHLIGEGTTHERFIYHEAHLRCDHCPNEQTSELVAAERARLVAQQNAGLSDFEVEPEKAEA